MVSNWESTHSERHGLRAKASFLKVDAFALGITTLSMVLRVVVCVLRDVCSAGGGTWGRTRGGHRGRGSLYRRAPPVDRRCLSSCPRSRQLESKTGGSNATAAWQPCCHSWKTNTFRNAALERKLPVLLIVTFLNGKPYFLHVTPFAVRGAAM